MIQIGRVSSEEALKLVQASLKEVEKTGKHIAVAVCGPEGELLSFHRMDNASPAASTIARNKAYTSACDRKSTKEMGNYMRNDARDPAFWGDIHITGFAGGAPIIYEGKVIGGIGISGLPEDEDDRIARLVIDLVYKGK
jgi:glc operon protein GlcG